MIGLSVSRCTAVRSSAAAIRTVQSVVTVTARSTLRHDASTAAGGRSDATEMPCAALETAAATVCIIYQLILKLFHFLVHIIDYSLSEFKDLRLDLCT